MTDSNIIKYPIILNHYRNGLQCEFILKENFISGIVSSGRFQYHFHSTYEVHIPVVGTEHIIVQDKDICVHPGEVCIIPPNTVHVVLPNEGNFCTGFRFDFSKTDEVKNTAISLFKKAFSNLKEAIIIQKCPIYRKYISVVIENFSSPIPQFVNADLLFLSLYEIALHIGNKIAVYDKKSKNSDIHLSDTIEEFLNEHYTQKILLEELAQHLNFSKRQTERIIARLFGMTFCELVNKKRLLVSKLLLKNTDLPIQSISQRVGFDNHHYFYRKFTAEFSTTPGQYRKQYNN